ncbi:MAG: type II secretion system protein GspM [Chloroflexi bacterium]|nr:type II secretion system protein GspM [Chloroflexota bacterium]
MKQIQQYLLTLTERDRRIMIIGSISAVILLYLGLFLLPAVSKIEKLEKSIVRKQTDYNMVADLVSRYQALPKTSGNAGKAILPFVENLGKREGIADNIDYLRPFGDKGGAELKLVQISSDKLVKILYEFQGAGIKVRQMNMRDYGNSGQWTAKIFLEE